MSKRDSQQSTSSGINNSVDGETSDSNSECTLSPKKRRISPKKEAASKFTTIINEILFRLAFGSIGPENFDSMVSKSNAMIGMMDIVKGNVRIYIDVVKKLSFEPSVARFGRKTSPQDPRLNPYYKDKPLPELLQLWVDAFHTIYHIFIGSSNPPINLKSPVKMRNLEIECIQLISYLERIKEKVELKRATNQASNAAEGVGDDDRSSKNGDFGQC